MPFDLLIYAVYAKKIEPFTMRNNFHSPGGIGFCPYSQARQVDTDTNTIAAHATCDSLPRAAMIWAGVGLMYLVIF